MNSATASTAVSTAPGLEEAFGQFVVDAPLGYLEDTARQLHEPANYIHGVLPAPGATP